MSELAETVNEAVEKASESKLNATIAVLVAVSATFMALCNLKGGNVVVAMSRAQTTTVDTWSFYQAKSTKQYLAESVAAQLEAQRDLLPAERRAVLDQRITDYQGRVARYDKEKEELQKKAEELERKYDRLEVRHDQFDMAEAALSVAIALFGITALTRKRWLLGFAGVVAAAGFVFGLAGFAGWNIHPEFLARLIG